jgi:hypothetical protein
MDGAVSAVIHVMSPTPKLCFATNSAISQAAVASVGRRRLAEASGVSLAREAGLHVEGGIPAAVVGERPPAPTGRPEARGGAMSRRKIQI